MAKGVINLQKESGGIIKISPVDGIGVTEVTVPESGVLVTKEYTDGLDSANVKQSANLSDLSNSATARSNLGLGTAATSNVGTAIGDVMRVGAFGLGDVMSSGSSTVNPTGFYYNLASAAANGGGAFFMDVKYSGRGTDAYQAFRLSNDIYTNRFYLHAGNGGSATGLRPPVEIHHTGNILSSTGSSTSFPMSQKSVTDEMNTKVAKVTSTDNAIVRFNGTTGEVQNSGVMIDDSGNVGIGVIPDGNYALKTSSTGGVDLSLFNIVRSGTGYPAYGYNIRRTIENYKYSYDKEDSANIVEIGTRSWTWKTAPIGVKGGPITWTNVMRLDPSGNLLLTSGTGALGYGVGAGGTVTQLTSKSTAVTLNKPCGMINTHTEALAAGATVYFQLNNSLLSTGDGVIITNAGYGIYSIRVGIVTNGSAYIYITNTGGTSSSQTIPIQFQVIKGSSN